MDPIPDSPLDIAVATMRKRHSREYRRDLRALLNAQGTDADEARIAQLVQARSRAHEEMLTATSVYSPARDLAGFGAPLGGFNGAVLERFDAMIERMTPRRAPREDFEGFEGLVEIPGAPNVLAQD